MHGEAIKLAGRAKRLYAAAQKSGRLEGPVGVLPNPRKRLRSITSARVSGFSLWDVAGVIFSNEAGKIKFGAKTWAQLKQEGKATRREDLEKRWGAKTNPKARPFFCSICDSELKADAKQLPSGRWACGKCQKELKARASEKSQARLFEEQQGLFSNPKLQPFEGFPVYAVEWWVYRGELDPPKKGRKFFNRDREAAFKFADSKSDSAALVAVYSLSEPAGNWSLIAGETPNRRANVPGFRDEYGQFHPIRKGKGYVSFLTTDVASPEEKAERKQRRDSLKMAEYVSKSRARVAEQFKRKHKSLSQFVRGQGGIAYKERQRGSKGSDLKSKHGFATELGMLSPKETGTTGLLNKSNRQGSQRYSAEYMMDAANVEGYRDRSGQKFDNIGDFISAVADDASGVRKFYTLEDLTEQGEAMSNPRKRGQRQASFYQIGSEIRLKHAGHGYYHVQVRNDDGNWYNAGPVRPMTYQDAVSWARHHYPQMFVSEYADNPPLTEWDTDEDEAFALGDKAARMLGHSRREARKGLKLYKGGYYSKLKDRHVEFIMPIEAHSAAEAKAQVKAMVTNEKPVNITAREVRRNPLTASGKDFRVAKLPQYGSGKLAWVVHHVYDPPGYYQRAFKTRREAVAYAAKLNSGEAREVKRNPKRKMPGSDRDPVTIKQAREIVAEAKDYLMRTWPNTETENRAFHSLVAAYEFAGFDHDRAFEAAQRELNKHRKPNPTVSQKISQLRREGVPQQQAIAIAMSEKRAGKVNPLTLDEEESIRANLRSYRQELTGLKSLPFMSKEQAARARWLSKAVKELNKALFTRAWPSRVSNSWAGKSNPVSAGGRLYISTLPEDTPEARELIHEYKQKETTAARKKAIIARLNELERRLADSFARKNPRGAPQRTTVELTVWRADGSIFLHQWFFSNEWEKANKIGKENAKVIGGRYRVYSHDVDRRGGVENPGLVDLATNLQAAQFLAGLGGKRKRNPKASDVGIYEEFELAKEPGGVAYKTKVTGYRVQLNVRDQNGEIEDYQLIGTYNTLEKARAAASAAKRYLPRGKFEPRSRKRKRKNPSVKALSETFQGKANGAVQELKASSSAPGDLARIGRLIFFEVNGKHIRIPGVIVAADAREKLWLTGPRAPMFSAKAKPGQRLDYGPITRIVYETVKAHIEPGKRIEYDHKFENPLPHLHIDHEGMPIISGGKYKIKREGITG